MRRNLHDPVVRKHVHTKTNGRCHLCGVRLSLNSMEMEHSRPKSLGGTNHMNNLMPSCRSCNREKGNRLTTGQMRRLKGNQRFQKRESDSGLGWVLGIGGGLLLLYGLSVSSNPNPSAPRSPHGWG